MSNKITDARIQELERLQNLKEEIKGKIEDERNAMQALRDSMDAETQESMSSSSKAVKDARRKESSRLNHQDVIDAYELTISRLEEENARVNKELEELQALMK